MRDLKFRIWDNLKNEWLKNKVYHSSININAEGIGEFKFKQHPEGYTIQQFTGLKDSKGIEIYEGDIVQNMIIGPVEYFLGEFSIGGVTPLKDFLIMPSDENQPLNFNLDLEIIGNIFENPELT